jgi:hypothetical protein
MAINSDSPVTDSGIPGLGTSGWYVTGEGSAGGMRPPSGELGQVPVAADPFESGQGPRPTAAQGHLSTSNDNNPLFDAISGVTTPEAAPPGQVVTPHHPNAGR